MKNLIEALQIFFKYKNSDYPTHCEHDTLYVVDIGWDEVSKEDRVRLNDLGFNYDENGGWYSFKYGSA